MLRYQCLTRVICGLLALYLLNISVDIEDPNPEYISEDLSFNEQESIIEILVEKVLGFEDAIKEYDDHDNADHIKKKRAKIDLLTQCGGSKYGNQLAGFDKMPLTKRGDAKLLSGFGEIDSPPPQV